MPFRSHYRLTLSGTLGRDPGVPERFSFGVCLAKGNGVGETGGSGSADGETQPNEGQFDDLVSASVAFFGRAGTKISDWAILKEVKLATIGADGKYTRDPFIAGVTQSGFGQGGEFVMPPQVALAVSLQSDRRGPTGKGRFYLPAPALLVDVDNLLVVPDEQAAVRASVVQWVNDINDEPGIDVLGLGVTIASTKGYNSPVTSVRVGRALDTVRSRRRSLAESYGPGAATNLNQNPANQ